MGDFAVTSVVVRFFPIGELLEKRFLQGGNINCLERLSSVLKKKLIRSCNHWQAVNTMEIINRIRNKLLFTLSWRASCSFLSRPHRGCYDRIIDRA